MDRLSTCYIFLVVLTLFLTSLTATAYLADHLPERWVKRLERWWRI